MADLKHPVFGTLTLDSTGGIFWEATRPLAKREIPVDLTVMGPVDVEAVGSEGGPLDLAAPFVSKLAAFDAQARDVLRSDYEDGPDSPVTLYLEHHLDEMPEKAAMALFGRPADDVDVDAFLAKVQLCRVGLYPDEPERCAVFDYSLGKDVTQYILAVTFDSEGEINGVDMES